MSTLEFDVADFLECFDEAFLGSLDGSLKKRDRDNLYNLLRNEIEKFILSIKDYDLKTQKIEIGEIEFMLSVFEIVDSEDTNGLADLEKFLEHMKKFSARHRNITKSLDNLNTKLMKQDMRIEKIANTENCTFSICHYITDSLVFFSLLGYIFYFIDSMKPEEFEICQPANYTC